MTRQAGHEGCPPCKCTAPYGEHCKHEHDAWLSVRQRMTLNLAAATYRHEGAREATAQHQLGYSPTRFRQVIGALIDNPRAMEEQPVVVARLRRLREMRREVRQSSSPAMT